MYGKIDNVDWFFGAVYLVASIISVGFLTVPGTSLLSDQIFTIGEGVAQVGFSLAKIIAMVALLGTLATNRTDFSKYSGIQYYAAITMVILTFFTPLSPFIEQFIQTSIVGGAVSISIQAYGFAIVSYLG